MNQKFKIILQAFLYYGNIPETIIFDLKHYCFCTINVSEI